MDMGEWGFGIFVRGRGKAIEGLSAGLEGRLAEITVCV
jgi:hypothetical protein